MVAGAREALGKYEAICRLLGLIAPTDLDDDHKQEYLKLNGLSGADFDKEYMDQMVSDHAKVLDAFTTKQM